MPGGDAVTDAAPGWLRLRRRLRRWGCVVIGGCGFCAAGCVFTPTHGPTGQQTAAPDPAVGTQQPPNSLTTRPWGGPNACWVLYPTGRERTQQGQPNKVGRNSVGYPTELLVGYPTGP